jgi:hypothetical protein
VLELPGLLAAIRRERGRLVMSQDRKRETSMCWLQASARNAWDVVDTQLTVEEVRAVMAWP